MSFYVRRNGSAIPLHELKNELQTTNLQKKAELMEHLLTYYRREEDAERSLMAVIKYVSGYTKDHTLAKLTNLFWECVDSQDSSLILLISQIVRNELQSPNEYMRGACLRNLAKTGNLEILKTVDEVIVENLKHPDAYVRSNACVCIAAMSARYEGFFEDAVEQLIDIAYEDTSKSCQQHAIHALGVLNMPLAYQRLIVDKSRRNSVPNPDVFACSIIDLIRSCWDKTNQFPPVVSLVELVKKNVILDELISILENTSASEVKLSAVTCLLWMSSKPEHMAQAVQACAAILLLNSNLDVKYHIIGIIETIAEKHSDVVETVAVDLLRLAGSEGKTSAPPVNLAERIIKLTIPSITSNTAKAAVDVLCKHLVHLPKKDPMQSVLLKGLRQLCTRFPAVAISVIDLLLNFLAECESLEVIELLRELIVCSSVDEATQESIIIRLIDSVLDVRDAAVLCQGIYLIGQFAQSPAVKNKFVNSLYDALQSLPLPSQHPSPDEPTAATSTGSKVIVKTVVLPDGSYGTQNVLVDEDHKTFGLRECVLSNQCANLLTVIAMAVCKVMLRKSNVTPGELSTADKLVYHKAILIISYLYKFYRDDKSHGDNTVTNKRLAKALRVLRRNLASHKFLNTVSGDSELLDAVLGQRVITDEENRSPEERAAQTTTDIIDSLNDEVVFFPTFEGLTELCPKENLSAALQGKKSQSDFDDPLSKCNVNGVALSGFSDPIYVEAFVRMNHLDVIIELMVTNQSQEMLTNVCINVGTHGDGMKILETSPESVDLPANQTLPKSITCTIRLSSTEAGLIFGYCTFNRGVKKCHFPLAELQVDLLDCLEESYVGSQSFRRMWQEFEWENKIPISLVSTGAKSMSEQCIKFVELLLEKTKMRITAENGGSWDELKTLSKDGIFVVNFCTKSIFNEDALVNLSMDVRSDRIVGTARIRSHTQGIALSLGDRIAKTQRIFSAISA